MYEVLHVSFSLSIYIKQQAKVPSPMDAEPVGPTPTNGVFSERSQPWLGPFDIHIWFRALFGIFWDIECLVELGPNQTIV